jgi:hypothetical protein
MKRDMDLVRLILLKVEAKDNPHSTEGFEIDGYTEDEILYHVKIMLQLDYSKVKSF